MSKKKMSRRKFLVTGGLGTLGVLAIGTYAFRNPIRRSVYGTLDTAVMPYSGDGSEPNLWFEITKDNTVILHSPKVEMGQGTFTSLAQMTADELDVSLEQIKVITAATSTGIIGGFGTGGSTSVASLWQSLRELAATMREMIKIEASKKLGVERENLNTKDGVISGGGKTLTYAQVVKDVSEWDVPDTPKLKQLSDYKFIGKPIARVDLKEKVFGDPIFGMDAEMDNMLHAVIMRPEHVGAKFKSADTTKAESMPGVVKVVQIDNWVAVVAESYAQALSAKNKMDVKWDIPKLWTEEEIRDMISVGNGNSMLIQTEGDSVDEDDEDVFSLEFSSPMGAHAQIEPNGAVAYVEGDKATVIISTQVIAITQKQVADGLDLDVENVNIIPTFLGGGFGRRLNTSHAIEAAKLSKAVGRPVKYFFTRKEEFQNDMFRPPTHHILKAKLNNEGLLNNIEHHLASGNVAIESALLPGFAHTVLGADIGAIRGGRLHYTKVPNIRFVQWHKSLPFATSWWRSLGLLANTFAIESFIDEMAIRANMSPVDFRLAQIDDSEVGKRIKKVIEVVAEKANYNDKPSNGRAMGLAVSIDTGSPCAQIVEVSVENDNIKVHKVTCVLDCGLAVNPDQVRAQCEGAIIMGMSASMHEKMTLKDGQLYPTIYGAYDMAMMRHAPKEINVHLIEGSNVPLPVGEPPLGPIGAAIGNAVRRLTEKRLTDLPLKLN